MCEPLRLATRRALGVLLLFCALTVAGGLALAADIRVVLDEAQLLKLPDRVATIVVGNPLIADVTLQAGGVLVLTGKGYGVTNLIVLDRDAKVLLKKTVLVVGPREAAVTVYRGIEPYTYSCAPDCERRVTLGDEKTYFETLMTQIGTRNSQALGKEAPK
jgi:putative type II/III system pilus formation protein